MEITSRQNPLIQRIKRMQKKRKHRRREEAFFVEGASFVLTAIDCGARIRTLVVCEGLLVDDSARRIVTCQQSEGTERASVSREVYEYVSERNNPDGLGAVIETQWTDLDALAARPTDVFVTLVEVSDPGNLGTILRTIESVAGAGCILVGKSTGPFHPRTVRASKGAVFKVRIAYAPDMETVRTWAAGQGVHTVATSARRGTSFWESRCPLPVMLVLGSEHEGLDRETIEACDQLVTIPMQGSRSSLNVAVAASLLLYELKRVAEAGDG